LPLAQSTHERVLGDALDGTGQALIIFAGMYGLAVRSICGTVGYTDSAELIRTREML